MKLLKVLSAILLVFLLFTCIPVTSKADGVELEYTLILTDQDGREVNDLRNLDSGDKINVEIELERTDIYNNGYDTYGVEFRLSTQGLKYNEDGVSFKEGTGIIKQVFDSVDSVGFAYYDMERIGVQIGNPTIVGSWSYTVEDPTVANISVPVAIVYITNDDNAYVPVGNARLYLEPNGGEIVGQDVSGEYPSGTVVTLPGAKFGDHIFEGWTDGSQLYAEGDEYTVTGVVTLRAQWKDLERNRQVLFDPNGGEITGDDPSGMYADGERITIPAVERNGFEFESWSMGGKEYKVGDEYIVDNSVVFIAQWADTVAETEPTATEAQETVETPEPEKFSLSPLLFLLLLIPILIILFLIFMKRYIHYSLVDGSVKLSYRDNERVESVQVYLYKDGKEEFLVQSDALGAGELLRLITGTSVISGTKQKFYKGRLKVNYVDGRSPKEVKVLIRAVNERFKENT